jgi:hypothetical protein
MLRCGAVRAVFVVNFYFKIIGIDAINKITKGENRRGMDNPESLAKTNETHKHNTTQKTK